MDDYIVFKEKAFINLEVAQWCYDNEKYDDSVNRSYYAMFHIATALLLKDGTKFGKRIDHDKVIGLFVNNYCNKKKVFPQLRGYLVDVQRNRDIADYKARHLTKKEA